MTWQTNLGFNMDVNVVILHCLIVQVMYSLSCSTGRVLLHTMQHVFFFVCTSIQIHCPLTMLCLILHFHCLYVEYHQFLVVCVAVAVHLLAFWLLLKEKMGL